VLSALFMSGLAPDLLPFDRGAKPAAYSIRSWNTPVSSGSGTLGRRGSLLPLVFRRFALLRFLSVVRDDHFAGSAPAIHTLYVVFLSVNFVHSFGLVVFQPFLRLREKLLCATVAMEPM
jgi:hypothetical protein